MPQAVPQSPVQAMELVVDDGSTDETWTSCRRWHNAKSPTYASYL